MGILTVLSRPLLFTGVDSSSMSCFSMESRVSGYDDDVCMDALHESCRSNVLQATMSLAPLVADINGLFGYYN